MPQKKFFGKKISAALSILKECGGSWIGAVVRAAVEDAVQPERIPDGSAATADRKDFANSRRVKGKVKPSSRGEICFNSNCV